MEVRTVTISRIPRQVRHAARDCRNGEIEWPLPLARAAVGALAAADRAVARLDVRDDDAEGRFVAVAWSAFEPGISGSLPQAVESSRAAAMAALDRAFEHHSWNDPWVVVTRPIGIPRSGASAAASSWQGCPLACPAAR
jgi:hypothetical protein